MKSIKKGTYFGGKQGGAIVVGEVLLLYPEEAVITLTVIRPSLDRPKAAPGSAITFSGVIWDPKILTTSNELHPITKSQYKCIRDLYDSN